MTKRSYKVGYKKPPKSGQFKPGESGNPRGRPPKVKNTSDILKKELDQEVTLTEGSQRITLTKKQAMLKHLVNKAVGGDFRAAIFVFSQAQALEISEETQEEAVSNLSPEDKKLLLRMLKEETNEKKKKQSKQDSRGSKKIPR